MVGTVMFVLGLAIVLAAVLWGINKLAPEPIKTWATVIVVVLAACYVAAYLMGGGTNPLPALHR